MSSTVWIFPLIPSVVALVVRCLKLVTRLARCRLTVRDCAIQPWLPAGTNLGPQDSGAQSRQIEFVPSSHKDCTNQAGVCNRLRPVEGEFRMIRLRSGLIDIREMPPQLSEHPCPGRPAAATRNRLRRGTAILVDKLESAAVTIRYACLDHHKVRAYSRHQPQGLPGADQHDTANHSR